MWTGEGPCPRSRRLTGIGACSRVLALSRHACGLSWRPAQASAVVLAVLLLAPAAAGAGEVRVLCSNGLREVMRELLPAFQKTTQDQVRVTYDLSANLVRAIESGQPFDAAILTPALVDQLIARGLMASDTRTMVARSPITLAVRSGHPPVDFSSADAFARTLRTSTSIAYAGEGASATFFLDLVTRLSLSAAAGPRIQALPSGAAVGAAVARGEVEFGVIPASEVLPIPGIQVAGPVPAELRGYITMTAAVGTHAAAPATARQLVAFLASPAADPVLEQRGMERVR